MAIENNLIVFVSTLKAHHGPLHIIFMGDICIHITTYAVADIAFVVVAKALGCIGYGCIFE